MLSVTPTKLSDYLLCPYKYRLRHVDKIADASYSAALTFGQTMHCVLQELHQSSGSINEFTDVGELLARHWNSGSYFNAEDDKAYFAKGHQALQKYCRAFKTVNETTIGTEVYLSYILKIGDLQARLGCKADRICINDERALEVIDYKTNASGKVPTPESLQSDLPTFLYYALARIEYPEHKRIQISFLNVLTLAKVSIEYSPAQVAANKQAFFQCLKTIAANKFAPTPSDACSWCSFQDNCAAAASRIIDFANIT